MSEWAEGNYAATTKAATVYEKEGKLLLAVAFDVGGTEMKSYHVLIQADGSVNEGTVNKIKEWSGWDGTDPFWFVEAATTGISAEVTVKNEPGFKDPTKIYPRIAWVNKAGGSAAALPDAADRKAVMLKYGAKFRAVAGPQPIGAKPAPTSTPPVKPAPATSAGPAPRRPTPVSTAVKHATLQECWELMQTSYPTLGQDSMTEKYYAFVDAQGFDQADMPPEGWDKVKAAIMADANVGVSVDGGVEPLPF